MKKFIAIDYGKKRTGVAISDFSGTMAFPFTTILSSNRKELIEKLVKMIEEEKANGIIIGLPLRLNGEESETTKATKQFAEALKNKINLPIFYINEALSSSEASDLLKEAGYSAKQIKDRIDQAAATYILNTFLNLPEDKRSII